MHRLQRFKFFYALALPTLCSDGFISSAGNQLMIGTYEFFESGLTLCWMQFDDFPERLQVGILAFAKAVESDPEVWIPLMACLAAKPEARALVCDIASALSDSYRNHTAEEAILLMSKLLHEKKI
jgi:hypothetical protein